MLKIRGPQDVGAGILFLAFGIAMLMGSADLAQGTPLRMGPGYAPRLLCYGLIIIGAALLLRGLKIDGESTGPWNFRAMIFVLLSILRVFRPKRIQIASYDVVLSWIQMRRERYLCRLSQLG